MTLYSFDHDRAKRYANAISLCPYARVKELIPILLLVYQDHISDCTLIDLGSGTGYLSNFIRPFVKEVIQVDKSAPMMSRSRDTTNILQSDLKEVGWDTQLRESADIVTSLATLHHIFEAHAGEWIDEHASIVTQRKTLRSWCQLLKPGGKFLVIDVGVPQIPPFTDGDSLYRVDMELYFDVKQKALEKQRLPFNHQFWNAVSAVNPKHHLDQYIQELETFGTSISLADIIRFQAFPGPHPAQKLLPIDFFNKIVDVYSSARHIAYFPRESQLVKALKESDLTNTLVTTIPTPWVFTSERDAVWFVKELFSLGIDTVDSPEKMVNHSDYPRVKHWIEEYLGMYSTRDAVYINWQLMFLYGEKPNC